MTREEAAIKSCEDRIKHLKSAPTHHYGKRQRERAIELEKVKIKALRPVSRERVEKVWSPCNFCAGAKYITGGVTAVYPVSETRQQEALAEGDFDFCPVCGKPLTDEAVDNMVMENGRR